MRDYVQQGLNTRSLFSEGPGEDELREFVLSWEDPVDVLSNISSLFANLNDQVVLGDVDPGVHIHGPVHIGAGSRVHSGVTIEGPVIIGENVSVRAHAQLRNEAYIGSNCVIGHGADIKRSICMDGSKMQDGTFVGDSLVGFGGRVGSGAILANRKFNQTNIAVWGPDDRPYDSERDFLGAFLGDFSRVGANCVLSPGTVVMPHTWLGSGVVASKTIPRELLVTVAQEHKIVQKGTFELSSGIGDYEHL